jgi:segregation and condensation protein B
MRLTQIVEALLFASDTPLTAADLARADERLDEDTVTAVVEALREEYDRTERAFQVYEVAGGYQMLTRPDFSSVLERYQSVPQSSRLSMPALEVLAILAYRQPLGRLEVEEIRGVQSSAVLRTLQDRALIEPVGRAEGLGRPMLYGTTAKFLEHFGFKSLEDLPRPDDLPVILRPRPPEEPEPVHTPFGAAEPNPLSAEAEAEAAALHLEVQPARDHAEPGDTEEVEEQPSHEEADAGPGAEASDRPGLDGETDPGSADESGPDIGADTDGEPADEPGPEIDTETDDEPAGDSAREIDARAPADESEVEVATDSGGRIGDASGPASIAESGTEAAAIEDRVDADDRFRPPEDDGADPWAEEDPADHPDPEAELGEGSIDDGVVEEGDSEHSRARAEAESGGDEGFAEEGGSEDPRAHAEPESGGERTRDLEDAAGEDEAAGARAAYRD